VPFYFRCVVAFVVLLIPAAAQDRTADVRTAFARAQHLRHGINASEWFAQSAEDYSTARTDRYTNDDDIALMAQLGFDSVRLSIDAVPLEQSPWNKEGFNADFMGRLDHAVDAMLAKGMAVQIDIHPESLYKTEVRTTSAGVDRFVMLWRKLAAHYATRDPEKVFFEIMNEPEVSDPYRWAGIQARAAAAIRDVAPRNTIIATGPNYSGIADLLTQQPLPDGNVIYTFHFYEPHEFTHQGAEWVTPVMPTGVTCCSTAQEAEMTAPLDVAKAWSTATRYPVFVGEFGAYSKADEASRVTFNRTMRDAIESRGMTWAYWEFAAGFGVYDPATRTFRQGLLDALLR